MASPVLQVGAFGQQKLPSFFRGFEDEGLLHLSLENAPLDLGQFKTEDLAQLRLTERFEHYHFVDAVHELRRELATSSLDSTLRQLGVEFVVDLGERLRQRRLETQLR